MNRRDVGQRVSRKNKGAKHKISKVQILSSIEVPSHKVMLVTRYLFDCPNSSLGMFHGPWVCAL